MIKIDLVRNYMKLGTNGSLYFDDKLICKTIELPWRDNINQHSCIPEGVYKITKRYSKRFKNHFCLVNVPNRSLILIHPANNALKELKGCIAPVLKTINDGVGEYSKKAFDKLSDLLNPFFESNIKVFIHIKNSQDESIQSL